MDTYQDTPLLLNNIINIANNIRIILAQLPLVSTDHLKILCDVPSVCMDRRHNHGVHKSLGLTQKAMLPIIAVLESCSGANLVRYEDLPDPW